MKVNGYAVEPYQNLCGANLCWSDLVNADLYCVNFASADLRETDLQGANFLGANLYNTFLGKDQIYRKGEKLKQDIIGYKKCYDIPPQKRVDCFFLNNLRALPLIVELIIPRGAIVFGINGRKFRTDKAIVKDIYNLNGRHYKRAYSFHKFFSYYIGDEIEVFDFNTEYNNECAEGIHFFKTKKEAIEW